jgi:hypothetical protein
MYLQMCHVVKSFKDSLTQTGDSMAFQVQFSMAQQRQAGGAATELARRIQKEFTS